MAFPLARDGLREMAAATVLLAGAALAAAWLCRWTWYGWTAAAVPLALWLWVLYFFRDPERTIPEGEGLLLFVSPADGVVSDITPVGPDSELHQPGVRIGVFMNVFNVHVNRSPCDGEVTAVEHSPGRWLDVRRPDAWHMNESVLISLTCRIGDHRLPVVVRQVAGMIARRIVCRLSQGDRVRRGERIGMIKFGSRLELLLPDQFNAKVTVHVGQKVLAGATVLAKVGTSPIIDPTSGANDA